MGATTIDPSQTQESMKVGKRLVELCQQGENRKAIEELYADTVNVVEAMDCTQMPGYDQMDQEWKDGHKAGPTSKAQLLKSCDWFFENTEVHGGEVTGPYPLGDEFACFMSLDCTSKSGPMAGQRMNMSECCVYKVKNGKIVESRFYYGMDC
jgi:ketosteroid isomerase-like protein